MANQTVDDKELGDVRARVFDALAGHMARSAGMPWEEAMKYEPRFLLYALAHVLAPLVAAHEAAERADRREGDY